MKKPKPRQIAKNTKQEKEPVHFAFWLGVGFFSLVIILILSSTWYLSKQIMAEENTPVRQLVINGETPYTNRADILAAIDNISLGNFFTLDVNEIQQHVADLPWVYSVSVRKQWPNELKIYVVDQQPVALWNGDLLLNKKGYVFQADLSRLTHELPKFYGPEGSEKLALENYQNLNTLLGFGKLAITELVLSERFAWQLTLNDGVMLNLGREDRVKRVQRFMDIYPEIKKLAQEKVQQRDSRPKNKRRNTDEDQQVEIDYIDLRYDTGLAVGWKAATEKQRA